MITIPTPTARALDACEAWTALGGLVRDGASARFVDHPAFADVPGTQRVSHIIASSPDEIDALLSDVWRAAAEGGSRTFAVDGRTPPPFEARLLLEGLDHRDSLVMLLDGPLVGAPARCDVRLVESERDWQAWQALSDADNRGYPVRPGVGADAAQATRLSASRRAKCPPLRYFIARSEGRPAGFFSSWQGVGGVGVVENLSVREAMRRGGIATALMHACVADARRHGASAVALTCNPHDWPKTWYARLGFRPVAVKRTYRLEPSMQESQRSGRAAGSAQ
ncbi:MAG: GNAT family N-acetyltransferase [Dehalococcoidia bacterium]|nr:GNAT family N-acetyltransferase [Dehalococcoidia bacterium]